MLSKEEIQKRIEESRKQIEKRRAVEKELGKHKRARNKQIKQFLKDKDVHIYRLANLERIGYKIDVGFYLEPSFKHYKIIYAIACCSPNDNYRLSKARLIIGEKLISFKDYNAYILSKNILNKLDNKQQKDSYILDVVITNIIGEIQSGIPIYRDLPNKLTKVLFNEIIGKHKGISNEVNQF